MSIADADMSYLLDGTLSNELSTAGFYLGKIIEQPIIITDGKGVILYPCISTNTKHIDVFVDAPPPIAEKDHIYSETEKCLYYHTIFRNFSAYIIIMDLPVAQVPQTLASIKIFESFFSSITKKKNNMGILEWQMYEYLFRQSNVKLENILILADYQLPTEWFYYINVMSILDLKSSEQWAAILSYTRDYFSRFYPEAIIVSGPILGNATYIIPSRPKPIGIRSYKAALEKHFKVTATFGLSQPHQLNNLRKACDEARIALHYPMVMNTKNEIQCFSELKYFTFLFSQELDNVKEFCWNMLAPLYDQDKQNNSCLFQTLAVLVKYNFNLKETAKSMFIHINTLYYRINKIEQLLGIDMSLANERLNLFTAINAWALLYMSGLWDCSFGLQFG